MRSGGKPNLDWLLDVDLTPDVIANREPGGSVDESGSVLDPFGDRSKEIPSFPGIYASENGAIWSSKSSEWKQLGQRFNRDGYLVVSLSDNDKRMSHQLVLEAFVGSRPDGMECRHLNDVKSDNRIRNLVWGTRTENAEDEVVNRTNRRMHDTSRKLTRDQAISIKTEFEQGTSIHKLSVKFGVTRRSVRDIVRGKTWKDAG